MTEVINAIGVVDSIFTIIGFFQSNLPPRAPDGATVQIKAGLGDDASNNLVNRNPHAI